MSNKVTLGGERLGGGDKMTVNLPEHQKSKHNLNKVIRTTMAAGTLVPFMSAVGLPGDYWKLRLALKALSKPALGPLYGYFDIHADVFRAPVRLYQGHLYLDEVGQGLKMKDVKLPQVELRGHAIYPDTKNPNTAQINPSSIHAYLRTRGLGSYNGEGLVRRYVYGVPYLMYHDVVKAYYANKQEGIGYVIHTLRDEIAYNVLNIKTRSALSGILQTIPEAGTGGEPIYNSGIGAVLITTAPGTPAQLENIFITTDVGKYLVTDIYHDVSISGDTVTLTGSKFNFTNFISWSYRNVNEVVPNEPQLVEYDLKNIDTMRREILINSWGVNAVKLTEDSISPYGLSLVFENNQPCVLGSQEGLCVRTYKSDLLNNWLSTEWISGDNGINATTAIDVSDGILTQDALRMQTKVYDMLAAIAMSDGTTTAWIEQNYSTKIHKGITMPLYEGSLINQFVFDEIVANTAASGEDLTQPLGQLGGKGMLNDKTTGGKIEFGMDEHSHILGIVSIVPRVDYSQGNHWSINLKTMDDFHKPALDGIGFQDLPTDWMAFWDTRLDNAGNTIFRSAGKQPAWVQYTTEINETFGNFAIENSEMFMTLNRRYEMNDEGYIKDLSTYIDPVKCNYIFAETARDAQNFMVQIAIDAEVSRRMSYQLIPVL